LGEGLSLLYSDIGYFVSQSHRRLHVGQFRLTVFAERPKIMFAAQVLRSGQLIEFMSEKRDFDDPISCCIFDAGEQKLGEVEVAEVIDDIIEPYIEMTMLL
jgi:hypothetical protein